MLKSYFAILIVLVNKLVQNYDNTSIYWFTSVDRPSPETGGPVCVVTADSYALISYIPYNKLC